MRNAARFIKAGAEAVKIEGGEKRAQLVERLVDAEIPVVGHIGLTPQSLHAMGGYKVQGKSLKAVEQLMHDALALERCGACCVVLEGIPREVAALITHEIEIPTIGIGAGPDCDGQVLVFHDVLGLTFAPPAKFVRRYADLGSVITTALQAFKSDVKSGDYPVRRGVVSPAQGNALDPAGHCRTQARHDSLGACRFVRGGGWRWSALLSLRLCESRLRKPQARPSAKASSVEVVLPAGACSSASSIRRRGRCWAKCSTAAGWLLRRRKNRSARLWDAVTVALVVPPPQGNDEPVTIDQAIEQAVTGVRAAGRASRPSNASSARSTANPRRW